MHSVGRGNWPEHERSEAGAWDRGEVAELARVQTKRPEVGILANPATHNFNRNRLLEPPSGEEPVEGIRVDVGGVPPVG